MVEILSPTCEKFLSYSDTTPGMYDIPDSTDDNNDILSGQEKLMKSEKLRLESYRNWPSRCYQRPDSLAKAGLYYTGIGDRVQCPFCSGVLKKWQSGDDPMEEHRHHFSYCKFVLGENVGNIPILHETVMRCNRSPSKNSPGKYNRAVDLFDFTKEDTRLKSFSSWPSDLPQTPEALAHAGFHHIPSEEKPDRVKCAYCHGKLYHWALGDDPWIEHARCFPTCPYIKLCVGEQLIDDLLAQHESKEGSRDSAECEAFDEISSIMQSKTVQFVLGMGFPSHLVKTVVEIYHRENGDFSTQELVNAILETQGETEGNVSRNTEKTGTVPRIQPPVTNANQSVNGHARGTSGQEEMTSGHSRLQGNAAPFSASFRNYVSYVPQSRHQVRFINMPCGHYACCRPCSEAMIQCSTCGTTITGCVQTM